jgi:hypothetical protein
LPGEVRHLTIIRTEGSPEFAEDAIDVDGVREAGNEKAADPVYTTWQDLASGNAVPIAVHCDLNWRVFQLVLDVDGP